MSAPPQRGAATLPITLMLSFALLMAVAFANRSVVFEVRSAGHQVRAAQAHEAAQAGLQWTLAQLNTQTPVGDDCMASNEPSALAWRDRLATGALLASCEHSTTGWRCHCPPAGDPRSVSDATTPAFRVQIAADAAEPDRWVVQASGHGGTRRAVQLQMRIGRLPGLDTLPAAALTVRGSARFDAAFALHHSSPSSGGVTLHTGGAVTGPALRLTSSPGTPAHASVVEGDAALASLTLQGLHASLFRLDRNAWQQQPTVHAVDCQTACDSALLDAAREHVSLFLPDGLRLDTPVILGSTERSVLLVVDGPVELHAASVIHGLVFARHEQWQDMGGARIHGAVIASADLHTRGVSHIHHDDAVLLRLRQRSGTFAPIAGSWRDL